jgi:hypothetical protein
LDPNAAIMNLLQINIGTVLVYFVVTAFDEKIKPINNTAGPALDKGYGHLGVPDGSDDEEELAAIEKKPKKKGKKAA